MTAQPKPPNVWLLLGQKAGDNNQVIALADALGWPYQEKRIIARPWELIPHLLAGITLAGIDRRRSDALNPPWPDLVISAGRRNEPVARWIQQQSAGACRLVHIGRPWAALDCYDLVVSTPQYFLPAGERVICNRLPLHRITPQRAQQAAKQIAPELGALPRPYTVVLLGGNSGPFVFTEKKARRMAEQVNQLVAQRGGSVLLTDSRRTPRKASDCFWQSLRVPAQRHDWRDPTASAKNPYLGYLGLADYFVVTGESMSMIAEASALNKPLYLFDLGDEETTWWMQAHCFRYKPLSHRLAMRFAPRRMRRDVGQIQAALVAAGEAQWLVDSLKDKPFADAPEKTARAPLQSELATTAMRVRQIMQMPA